MLYIQHQIIQYQVPGSAVTRVSAFKPGYHLHRLFKLGSSNSPSLPLHFVGSKVAARIIAGTQPDPDCSIRKVVLSYILFPFLALSGIRLLSCDAESSSASFSSSVYAVYPDATEP
jgi:hypothetical protein